MRIASWIRLQEQKLHLLLWDDGAYECPPPKRWGIAILRHAWIAAHGFRVNRLAPQAASLTYASLLALVPFLLLAFLIARSMNMQALLHGAAADTFGAQLPVPVEKFLHSTIELVDQTDTVPLGIVGILILFGSVLHLMRIIHLSLSRIWRVHRPPFSLWQIASYGTIMLIGPSVLLAAAWIPLIASSLGKIGGIHQRLGPITVLFEPLGMLAFVVMAFTAIYRFTPSTRVYWKSALVGGVAAGIMWLAWQYVCAWMQTGVSSYNAIYGAFAVLPVVLIWMYANWTILLVGGELSFANQYFACYDPDSERIRPSSLEAVLLAAAALATICKMQRNNEQFESDKFAARYGVPEGIVSEMLDQLVLTGMLIKKGNKYLPADESANLNLADVNASIYAMSSSGLPFTRRMPERLRGAFETARQSYLACLQEVPVVDDKIPPPQSDNPDPPAD